MSVFKLLPLAVLCIFLTGCQSLLDVFTLPPPSGSVHTPRPLPATPGSTTTNLPPADLDFRIVDARARIGGRDYVMDVADRPVITALGDDTYRLDLILRRDSKSS